jgi:putative ubiquitin-RnfH superfamily antitoxin RatB of RatAB toxin-antitoxin module
MTKIQIGIAYVQPPTEVWLRLEIPEQSTVQDAIEQSGILQMCPCIDLAAQEVGVFGKVTRLDARLSAGDRIEIYRPITCDPRAVPRRDAGDGDSVA